MYRGLVDLVSQFDSALKAHIKSNSLFKGILTTVQNDILLAIQQVCKQSMEKEVQAAEFLATMTDETTDISDKSQVVITFRYMKNGMPVERFWGFFNPVDLLSETLFNLLNDEVKPLIGQNPEKLISQTYDGAAVLRGVNRGVQAKMREVHNNAYFVHCYAHQLNLIIQKAVSQNTAVSLAGIPSFFSRSSLRMSVLENITSNKHTPRPFNTRWNFKSRTVNAVYELQEELIECFSQLAISRSTEIVSAAVGLKRMMKDPQFLFWLKFFSSVMPHVDIVYRQIQARNIDAVRMNQCVSSFEASVQKIRDACNAMDVGECNSGSSARRSAAFTERRREAKEVCDVNYSVPMSRAFSVYWPLGIK